MADFSGARPLLPQGPHSYSCVTSQPDTRDRQKNYVFVDEHNRHRRLKGVMRACGACRRRKIKCDAATTNSWPCAACQKQRLECIPPLSDKDGSQDLDGNASTQSAEDHTYQPRYDTSGPYTAYSQPNNGTDAYSYAPNLMPGTSSMPASIAPSYWSSHLPSSENYEDGFGTLHTPDPINVEFRPPSLQKTPSSTSWMSDRSDHELADALQELKIDQGGVAPYITNQRNLADGPAVEESEVVLPPPLTSSHTASIPVEMMPPSPQAMQSIEYFFTHIHTYVPVLNKSYFDQQWHSDRTQISPLILEGIFACSAQMMRRSDDRSRWLALASRHEESFKDVPRLSTIQGMILVLKAREAVPKRGYYYRSWMTVQYLISMAKDLELDEHNTMHIQGQSCGLDDCAVRTRIWLVLFQLEMMIGGPQGRTDFHIDPNTINTGVAQVVRGSDELDRRTSQDQLPMIKIVQNVRRTSDMYRRIRKAGNKFAQDPHFVQHNASYYLWLTSLPRHLQIDFKADRATPAIPSHYAANLHCYHWLSIVMHHRPQLDGDAGIHDPVWKSTIKTCYNAATKICRLHEAILQQWGLNGLLCMLRGINTAIYTILTCAMLHLVAITSPDPELNSNAKDFFTRHMRILEQCSSSWPMPAIQIQIDSIREAFSADLSKPFELRANFPFGSPHPSDRSSPPEEIVVPGSGYGQGMDTPRQWSSFDAAPLTPPATAGSMNATPDYISSQSYGTPEIGHAYTQAPRASMQWDPSAVFDRWTSAFNTAALETASPGLTSLRLRNNRASIPPGPTSAPLFPVNPPQKQSQQVQTMPFGYTTQSAATSPGFPPQLAQSHLQPHSHSHSQPHPLYQQHQQQDHPEQDSYISQAPNPLFGTDTNFSLSHSNSTSIPSKLSMASRGGVLPYVTPSMWQDTVARSYGEGVKRRRADDSANAGDDFGDFKRMR